MLDQSTASLAIKSRPPTKEVCFNFLVEARGHVILQVSLQRGLYLYPSVNGYLASYGEQNFIASLSIQGRSLKSLQGLLPLGVAI
jgi:hypothetical protein